jgi:hypothetical protein
MRLRRLAREYPRVECPVCRLDMAPSRTVQGGFWCPPCRLFLLQPDAQSLMGDVAPQERPG